MTLNLPLWQERQEGIRRSNVCILRTKAREMMNGSRISRAIVVLASSFGGLNVNVQCGQFEKIVPAG